MEGLAARIVNTEDAVISFEDLAARDSIGVTFDLLAVYKANETKLAAIKDEHYSTLLVRGGALKKIFVNYSRLHANIGGFLVRMDGMPTSTDLTINRLTACVALKAVSVGKAVETAMYLKMPAGLQTDVTDIKTLICPGLQYIYKIADKMQNVAETGPLATWMRGVAQIRGKIICAAIGLDWDNYNFRMREQKQPEVGFKTYCSLYHKGFDGAFKGICTNNGWGVAGKMVDLPGDDATLVAKYVNIDAHTKPKGASVERAGAVYSDILRIAKEKLG